MPNSSESTSVRVGDRALVLGGGGPVGRAWESGLAAGLLAHGIDLAGTDLIIGTSAGAIVGAEIALGLDLESIGPAVDLPGKAKSSVGTQQNSGAMRSGASLRSELGRKSVGLLALSAQTITEEASLARLTFAPLRGREWPTNFWATSISTHTGQLQIWNAASSIPLERAVASSSALPGVWPPITIGEERYMDGGVRSMLNADLAAGHTRVLIVSCFALTASDNVNAPSATISRSARDEIETLQNSGSAVEVITPDDNFLALTSNGTKMLDNSLVPAVYEAGKRQAQDEIDRIRGFWSH